MSNRLWLPLAAFVLGTVAWSGARAQDGTAEPMQAAPEASAAPAPATSTATEPAAPEHHGLFGALRIGPTASVGFPFLLNYGLDATWDRSFGFAFSGGRLGRELKKETEIEIFNWDLRARWFPWEGSFFLGAAYGKQGIVGRTKQDLKIKASDVELKVPTTLRLEVNNTYLTPHFGWFATWDVGFTLGFELGYQIPMSSKAELQTAFDDVSASTEDAVKSQAEYKKAKDDLEKAAESFGKKSIPYVNLLRLGWLL